MTRADSVHVPTNQGKSTVRILVAVAKKVNQDKHIRKPQVISGVGGGGCAPQHPPPRSAPASEYMSRICGTSPWLRAWLKPILF